MRIYKEEIFGPVLSVVRAKNYEEALRLPSEHDYGNGVAIFTRDGDTARDFTNRVNVGMVGVNFAIPVPLSVHILSMLCEGSSMRSISRVCDVSINTVSKLLVDAGRACAAFHDEKVRAVKAHRVQVDEIWSFTYAKQKNVPTAKRQDLAYGDTWTWTAIDADTKLLITWLVGGRDGDYAIAFMDDLRARLARLCNAGQALRRHLGRRQGPLQPR
jgi:Aldehyde dehydrogenase family